MKGRSNLNVKRVGGNHRVTYSNKNRSPRLRPVDGGEPSGGGLCLLIVLCFAVAPFLAFSQRVHRYVDPVPPAPVKYEWKTAIAPASMTFAAGAFIGRDNGSKFVRQGFLIGAGLTIGFGGNTKRPGWHYAVDVAACAVGFVAGRLVGENVNYR